MLDEAVRLAYSPSTLEAVKRELQDVLSQAQTFGLKSKQLTYIYVLNVYVNITYLNENVYILKYIICILK